MADERVLITGSFGLIGVALRKSLAHRCIASVGVDLRAPQSEYRIDVRDQQRLKPILDGFTGIVHLAAVSRVIDGERTYWVARSM